MKGVGIYNVDSTTIKQDADLLEENVTRILLTVPGERVGNPLFGSKFKTFLFDLGTIMQEEILSDIFNSVSKWEPRVTINNIKLTPSDPNILSIKIDGVVKQTLEIFTFDKVIRF